MFYSSVALIALVITFIINYDIFKGALNADSNLQKIFSSYRDLLIGEIVYFVSDALWGILYEAELIKLTYIDTVIYFLAMAATVFLWIRCVIVYLAENNISSKLLFFGGVLFLAIVVVSLIVNIFYPIVFSMDGGVYTTGPMRFVTLGLQVIIFTLTTIYALIFIPRSTVEKRNRYITIGAFGLVMILFISIQFYYPLLPLYAMGLLLGSCLLHTFVLEGERKLRRQELEEALSREKLQVEELIKTKLMAYTDSLTGVRNGHALVEEEAKVNEAIFNGTLKEFALVAFDINGLKMVNDTYGHNEGDKFIQDGCKLITDTFKESKVYRVGGDEFVAVLEGNDYNNRFDLLEEFERKVDDNLSKGLVVVSSGLGEFDLAIDKRYRSIFLRADKKMYERKRKLKNL